jgi:hypothetical protein
MNIGLTGHQKLDNPRDWEWVKGEIDRILTSLPSPVIGLSSLAVGADQLFAKAILQHKGSLEVIIPFPEYESTFDDGPDREWYQQLLKAASKINVMRRAGSDEECYFAAGKKVVDGADVLVAVWNGKPAAGLGGTGDIVKYARQRQKRTIHLNPITHEVTDSAGRG